MVKDSYRSKIAGHVHPLARSPGAAIRAEIYETNSQIATMAKRLMNRMLLLGIDDPSSDPVCAAGAQLLIAMIDERGGGFHEPGAA
jgi:hypothetical protein